MTSNQILLDFSETPDGYDHVLALTVSRANAGPIKEQVAGGKYRNNRWEFPTRPDILIQLATIYGEDLQAHPHILNWFGNIQEARTWREELYLGAKSEVDHLRDYQAGAVAWLNASSVGLLTAGTGIGKTRIALEAMFTGGNQLLPNLAIVPQVVQKQWLTEAQDLHPDKRIVLVAGTPQKRRKLLAEEADLYIISIGSVASHAKVLHHGNAKRTKKDAEEKELNWMQFNTIVVDEGHRLCSPTNKSTRAIWGLSSTSDRRYILTATPVRNRGIDVWSPMRFLLPDVYTSKSKFKEFYLEHYIDHYGYEVIKGIREERADAFEKTIGAHILTIEPDDVIDDLPDEMYHFRMTELSAKHRKQYNGISEGFLRWTDQNKQERMIALPHSGQRHAKQIQSAQAMMEATWNEEDEQWETVMLADQSPKIDVLEDILASIPKGEQTVVFVRHRDMAAAVFDRVSLVHGTGLIIGGVSGPDRDKVLGMFDEGNLRVLVCSIAAMSEGVNLTAANHVVYVEGTYSAVEDVQTKGRVRRMTQEKDTVHYYYILAEDTVDVDQFEAVEAKAELIRQVRGIE